MLTGTRYIIGGILCAVLVAGVIFGIRWVTADVRGAGDAREQTRADGTYRIAAYERFYDDCAAIQAIEDKIAAEKARKASEDYTEGMKSANIQALTGQRAQLIRGYNQDARKHDTRGHFLSSDLPYEIEIDQENTECEAND